MFTHSLVHTHKGTSPADKRRRMPIILPFARSTLVPPVRYTVWGAPDSAGMWRHHIPALLKAPALLEIAFIYYKTLPGVPRYSIGTVEGGDTIRSALWRVPHCCGCAAKTSVSPSCLERNLPSNRNGYINKNACLPRSDPN